MLYHPNQTYGGNEHWNNSVDAHRAGTKWSLCSQMRSDSQSCFGGCQLVY